MFYYAVLCCNNQSPMLKCIVIKSNKIIFYNMEVEMINTITCQELESLLSLENPSWNSQSIHERAKEYLLTLDERLEPSLTALVKEGKKLDFQHGEFSIYLIQALRHNCSFLEAIILMDAYIKDSLNGKALILRR